jgi:hypothetical protein
MSIIISNHDFVIGLAVKGYPLSRTVEDHAGLSGIMPVQPLRKTCTEIRKS